MKKRILSAILCATTLFSAISFSACEVTDVLFADYKEQIAEMQERINEKEEQIATLEQENENLQGTITELQEEIENLQQEEQDFVLKISMEKEVYTYVDQIPVEIVLENHSGEDVEIFYYEAYFLVPESDTGGFPDIELPHGVTKKLLKDGESLCFTERVDSYFTPGQHVLKYHASFYLDEGLTNGVGVYSNEIEFKKLGNEGDCRHNTEQDNQDFVLTISMEKEIYTYGDRAPIEIVLENHSGEDIEIFYYWLCDPESDTGVFPVCTELPPYPNKKLFKNGESLRFTDYANGYFGLGDHKVKFYAVFYLDEACTNSVIVHSNELEFKIVNKG